MIARTAGLALILALGLASAADACAPVLQQLSPPRGESYEPFDPGVTVVPFEVEVRNTASEVCQLSLTIVGQQGQPRRLTGPDGELVYDLVTETSQPIANQQDPAFGAIFDVPGGTVRTVRLNARFGAGQIKSSGRYRDLLRFRLIDAASGAFFGPEKTTSMYIDVTARAQANIAGAAGSFGAGYQSAELDFGTLVSGAERRSFLQIRANEPVLIGVSSLNAGALRHATLLNAQPIPYRLRVDGEDADLEGYAVLSRSPGKTLEGSAYELVVSVPDISGRFAGQYEDTITFDVSPDR